MKCASTRELIEKLKDYEESHGIGAIIGISQICFPDRSIEYKLTIENNSNRNSDKYEEIDISSIDDKELFGK